MITFDSIPSEKFDQFHEILCSTNGRYLSNPYINGKTVKVHYTHDNITERIAFHQAEKRLFSSIKEIRADQWWKLLYRRFTNIFNWL